jgi:hypothetical protein
MKVFCEDADGFESDNKFSPELMSATRHCQRPCELPGAEKERPLWM